MKSVGLGALASLFVIVTGTAMLPPSDFQIAGVKCDPNSLAVGWASGIAYTFVVTARAMTKPKTRP